MLYCPLLPSLCWKLNFTFILFDYFRGKTFPSFVFSLVYTIEPLFIHEMDHGLENFVI